MSLVPLENYQSERCQRQFKTDPFYLKNSKVKLTPLMIY